MSDVKVRWADVEAPSDLRSLERSDRRSNHKGSGGRNRRSNGDRGSRRQGPRRTGPIRFFGKKSKYAIFSNFADTPMTIGGLEYPTVEHYFQSMKFVETAPEYAEEIRVAATPLDAKRLGKSRDFPIDENWADSKRGQGNSVTVMRRALLYKALQSTEFRDSLLSTRDEQYIIEASPFDSYWGEGRNKKGKNMLGKLLVELRFILRAKRDSLFIDDHVSVTVDDEGSGENHDEGSVEDDEE